MTKLPDLQGRNLSEVHPYASGTASWSHSTGKQIVQIPELALFFPAQASTFAYIVTSDGA
jgi:hypothetical protein